MKMSGKPCAVAICRNNDKSSSVSFHRFPRDNKLRKIWILKCQREDQFNTNNSRICSAHFKPVEFERDLQAELLGSRPKARLKPNVIPTLNLKKEGVTIVAEPRQKQILETNEEKIHNHLVESTLEMTSTEVIDEIVEL